MLKIRVPRWKVERGYDRPLLYNTQVAEMARFTNTIFFDKSLRLFAFDFGVYNSGRDIGYDIRQRIWPSLTIAVPTLLVGLAVNISFALLIALFRATYIDYWGASV